MRYVKEEGSKSRLHDSPISVVYCYSGTFRNTPTHDYVRYKATSIALHRSVTFNVSNNHSCCYDLVSYLFLLFSFHLRSKEGKHQLIPTPVREFHNAQPVKEFID